MLTLVRARVRSLAGLGRSREARATLSRVYRVLADGTTSQIKRVLAVFDPTLLSNDAYVIRLIAQDTNGNVNSAGVIVRARQASAPMLSTTAWIASFQITATIPPTNE